MRAFDLVLLSTRMFRTRPSRTLLTILGVSVGIGTIVFLVSLGYGLQTILIEKITTSESLLSLDVFPPDSQNITLNRSTLAQFSAIPQVKEIIGITLLPAQLTFGDTATDATGNITSPAFFRLAGIKPAAGALYGENDEEHIVISATLAKLFGWNASEAVGKRFFLVVSKPVPSSLDADMAISTSTVSNEEENQEERVQATVSGVIEGESSSVYFSPSLFKTMSFDTFSQAKVRVQNADVFEEVRSTILNGGFIVSALSDVVDQANKVFKALQAILAVFGAAALLVSAIGMFNTMTIAFLERTQEIGIMRALGASRRDMFAIFLGESSVMGFFGGFFGVVIGYVAELIANAGINLLASSLGGQPIDLFRTPISLVVIIVIFSTVVGFLTGVFPGRRASRLNPLDALMYK